MSNERNDRIQKLNDIRAMGVVPFAPRYKKLQNISQILENRQSRNELDLLRDVNDIIANPNRDISTAGRLTLYRSHGKLAFGKLMDESGEIQIMFHRDNLKMLRNRPPHKVNQGDQIFDPNQKHLRRHVVKMVIIDEEGKVATTFAANWDNYSLPGGGVDEGDNFYDAVHREALEETGTPAKVIHELPKVHEYLKRRNRHQLVYGYLCKTDGPKGQPEFIESEILDGNQILRLDIYDLRDKIKNQVENCEKNTLREGLDGIFKRDLIILESAIAVLEKQKIQGNHESFEDIVEIKDNLTLGEIENLQVPYFEHNEGILAINKDFPTKSRKGVICIVKNTNTNQFLGLDFQYSKNIIPVIGGGLDENEDIIEGAKREIFEESGLKKIKFIKNLGYIHDYFFSAHKKQNSYSMYDILYFETNSDKLENTSEEEQQIAKPIWIDEDNIYNIILESKRDDIKYSYDLLYNKNPIVNKTTLKYNEYNPKPESDPIIITPYKFVEKYIDIGDFIGIKGELFTTKHGEATIFVSEFQLLSKSIRPLGDKFHGIGENAETAYRQRYLDMIFNRETINRFKLRSKFTKTIRDFYHSRGFIEIETPVLGNSASGAAAAPFITHHNDFDIDMYLHIAPETSLKKATVGGLEKVFEICKNFRNEGSDPSHHQEYTTCEHYAAYRNYEDNMKFTEDMFDYIFDNIPELSKIINVTDKEGNTKEVNFQTPRPKINYIEQIQKDSGIDVSKYGPEDEQNLRSDIKAKGFTREGIDVQTTATMIDYLYKKVTRPKIVGPAFIINYPKTMQPLARTSDLNSNIVEQFQLLINGRELLKAYSELVDPIEQQENFDAQALAVAKGDDEATKGDDDFVLAMEYGMPCQSGRGMGIDRIFAMLTEQPNIRDVILFPMIKPDINQ